MSSGRRNALGIAVLLIVFVAGVFAGRISMGNHVTPAIRKGTLTLVSGDRTAFVVQPDGSHTSSSYATPDMWIDPGGTTHMGDFPTCVSSADYGKPIEYGVVTVRPRGDVPGTDQVIWVRCFTN